MRWKSWYPADVGDKRVSTWFAFLPVKIGNDCRWWETVTVEFELKMDMYDVFRRERFVRKEPHYYWRKVRFVDTLGIAAYSNDPDSPKANFSSKKVFDKYDNEIQFGDFVRVDGKVVVRVTEDGTGDLVFSPYDKEDLVRAYWMNSLEVVYPIGSDGLCYCNCGSVCPLGKTGSSHRCTSSELSGSGKIVVAESEVKK